ncbi:hypothetical protein [Bosea sp. (in: a-proteobacteria)]|jgi:hypothetical protein|uniref:hypothetical protein n=1 Tax=Bosea sp. (in: a-proteobacteria) TaxID=1871050 RepID=UPI002DDD910C|nr:hypothetical protein [Bosea sp. (in: a-proteobacteria)]HEV2509690.1 hypothetical protein [Bosea sp. (in: a-proteobacteria)]
MDQMSFAEFKKTLLALIHQALDKEGFNSLVVPARIAAEVGLPVKAGWIDRAVEQFEANGWAKVHRFMSGASDEGIRLQLTGAGVEQAEEYFEEGWEQFDEAAKVPTTSLAEMLVPASDRIVSLNDNEHATSLRATLVDLEPRLAGNNELPAQDAEEFERRFAEFQAGNLLIKASTGSTRALGVVLLGSLMWFLDKLAETTIAPLLSAAAAALRALLGV